MNPGDIMSAQYGPVAMRYNLQALRTLMDATNSKLFKAHYSNVVYSETGHHAAIVSAQFDPGERLDRINIVGVAVRRPCLVETDVTHPDDQQQDNEDPVVLGLDMDLPVEINYFTQC